MRRLSNLGLTSKTIERKVLSLSHLNSLFDIRRPSILIMNDHFSLGAAVTCVPREAHKARGRQPDRLGDVIGHD